MKNIIFVITILLFATACSKILEEKPKAVATETFYNTSSEIKSAVYAIYSPTNQAVASNSGGVWFINGAEVDYAYGRLSYSTITDFIIFSSTTIGRIDDIWNYLYRAIRNANLVIKNAPNSSLAPKDEITQYVAEARFLRAFNYFYLVRNWAGVPLRTTENMLLSDVPRSPEADVYALIVEDLEYAEANLPETQVMAGRADKYAAKAMLTHVYLQLGRWSDARNKALEIINSNRYSLIKVTTSDDFYKIFGPDINRSSEEVFYLKFNRVDAGSYICRMRHYPGAPYFNMNGVYGLYSDSVTYKVIREWDYKDLRKKFNLYNWNIGFGKTTMLFKKFVDPAATTSVGNNDFPAYRYPDILLFYAEADCRANNGPTAGGMEKLNMIHRRAYGKDPNVTSTIDFKVADYTKDTFIDLVLKEGCYEQFDEAKRFFELRRTGKFQEVIKLNRGIDVTEAVLLWPIPKAEYDYNKAIDPTKDQNPGY